MNEFEKKVLLKLDQMQDDINQLKRSGCLLNKLPISTATAVNIPDDVAGPIDRAGAPLAAADLFYGINIPYINYGNDILGKWDHKPLSKDSAKRKKLLDLFRTAREEGFAVVRFWFFPTFWHDDYNDMSTIKTSIDVLFQIAQTADVKLVPTITSFNAFDKEKDEFGRLDPIEFLSSATGSQLIQTLRMCFDKHKGNIMHIDLINEIEWAITDIPDADPNRKDLHVIDMYKALKLIDLLKKAVPSSCDYILGSASLKWSKFAEKIGHRCVDFHAYEGWSIDYFPPLEKGKEYADSFDADMYMGETDVPVRYWEQYREVYKSVFLWAEPDNYKDSTQFREFLRDKK